MDFLKSAVASAISKDPPFAYKFGDKLTADQSIWSLYNGTKRDDGADCSIFSFDCLVDRSRLPLARNAVKKMRTLRHPGVIKVLDTVETETYIYVATERVTPLAWSVRRKALSEETSKWGLHTVANTLAFLHDEAASVHGNIRLSSIYMSQSGEWRIGGFEILSSVKDDEAIIYRYGGLVPELNRYASPEIAKSGWDSLKRNPISAVDSYGYGTLISEVFNGNFLGNDQIGTTKGIPSRMQACYKRLLNANPKARLSVTHFLEQGKRDGGFFETPLIKLSEGIESLGLKSDAERGDFLKELDEVADDFPEEYFSVKVLPELLKSVEFGGGGPQVFASIMRIGKKLPDEEWDAKLTPVLVRLFSNPDRAIRVCLLDNLPNMIDHLNQKTVNDKIFPQMVTGFTDVAPIVREQTVKAVLTIVNKLADRTINGELLKHLAKTANDEQAGIRTNTTICMGKIARNLGPNTRQKVLVAAFSRALRDPFVHARNAALLALAATADCFSDDDCASKILPSICPSLVDKEKLVRETANRTFDTYVQRIRKYANTLPDSILPPPTAASVNGAPRMGTPQNDAAGWAGWAISSFTNKLNAANGEIQTTSSHAQSASSERSSSVPPRKADIPKFSDATSAVSNHLQAPIRPTPARTHSDSLLTENAEADQDFEATWGDFDEDESFHDPDEFAPAQKNATPVPYDDGGEPDFEGWLKAQAQSKSKSSASKVVKVSTNSSVQNNGLQKTVKKTTTSTLTPKVEDKGATAAASKLKTTVVKEITIKPKEDDDDWGDAWD